MKKNNNVIEVNNTETKVNKTSGIKYVTPDGVIFCSREEYIEYMQGL